MGTAISSEGITTEERAFVDHAEGYRMLDASRSSRYPLCRPLCDVLVRRPSAFFAECGGESEYGTRCVRKKHFVERSTSDLF